MKSYRIELAKLLVRHARAYIRSESYDAPRELKIMRKLLDQIESS